MKVRVTRTIVLRPSETVNVRYVAREEPYTAPRAHIEAIERAGAGKRVVAKKDEARDAE